MTGAYYVNRFRWAACQLDSLEKCLNLGQLRTTLASLPETLDGTYSRILASIAKEYREDAIRILQFLTFSERPLTIGEAVDAIAVDPSSDPSFDTKLRLPVPEEILRICSSLVSLVTRQVKLKGIVMELQLAHFSVKEYLTSEKVEKTFQEGLAEISARRSITKVCLAYLSHLGEMCSINNLVRKPEHPREERLAVKEAFPLAEYSAQYWMDHARPVEAEKDI